MTRRESHLFGDMFQVIAVMVQAHRATRNQKN
jgi:hypothetical protein